MCVGERPAGEIPQDAPLVQCIEHITRALGLEPTFKPSSTDANIPIARGIPAVRVGITRGRGAHQADESIDIPPIKLGLRQLLHLVEAFPVDNQR